MYEGREVFANAPLAFVTAEVRLAYEPDVVRQEVRDKFADFVRDRFPVLSAEMQESDVIVDPDGVETREKVPLLRARSEDERTSLTLSVHSLTIETVEYESYDEFSGLIEFGVAALVAVAPRARIRRLGLRYIDEIRVPGIESSKDWIGWLAPAFTAPLEALPNYNVSGLSGAMVVPRDDDQVVFFRWGEVLGSTVVSSETLLKAHRPEQGRFFVLDVDSAWEPDESHAAAKFDTLGRFSQLHDPVGVMFLSALTERVKQVFRGERS